MRKWNGSISPVRRAWAVRRMKFLRGMRCCAQGEIKEQQRTVAGELQPAALEEFNSKHRVASH